MKRNHKIILLILTLLPLLLLPVIAVWAIGGAFQLESFENPEPGIATYVGGIILWALLAGIIALVTWDYYLVHAIQNQTIDSNERIVWVILFVFIGLIPQVIYFFMRIWDLPEPQESYLLNKT